MNEQEKGKILTINEGLVKDHLGEMVRSTVEETLNQMLDAEAERMCNAQKWERSDARTDSRAGYYKRDYSGPKCPHNFSFSPYS